MKAIDNMKNKYAAYQELDSRDKKTAVGESIYFHGKSRTAFLL